MRDELIRNIMRGMAAVLDKEQSNMLEKVLIKNLKGIQLKKESTELAIRDDSVVILLRQFQDTLKLEGKSEKTISQYVYDTQRCLYSINKPVGKITTFDIKAYLNEYQEYHSIKKSTLNNMRRYISAFFNWLELEEIIDANPVRKIKTIKQDKTIMKPFSAKQMEIMRAGATSERELALIEVLYSTAGRVSEVAGMNITDIRDNGCVVFGKGAKEREVYFSEAAMLHLERYIKCRKGTSEALFTSSRYPYARLTKGGIESCIRKLGRNLDIEKVHPHRFRRTCATDLIRRGMPIQEVKEYLGHEKIDTTMIYCSIDRESVRMSHKKHIA